MKNLITEYPSWAPALCVLVGIVYAALLYHRNPRSAGMPGGLRIALALIRFAAVTVIAFLVLGPMIKYHQITLDQPVVVIAVDNSSSLIPDGDTTGQGAEATALRNTLEAVSHQLSGRYEVAEYLFGQEVVEGGEPDFSDPVTDISDLLESLKNRYANRNLGAVILASDGIYNRGRNPRYAVSGLKAPVHTLALGDTAVRRDVKIAETGSNRIAFLNNIFPIEARVEATKMDGRNIDFFISEKGEVLFEASVVAEGDNFSHTFRSLLDADAPGLREFEVAVADVEGEVTRANNRRTVYVDVIDSRRKVLILAEAPHPDVLAIRQAISGNENYEVRAAVAGDFAGNLSDFDLVITHNLPGNSTAGRDLMVQLAASELPFWAIAGLGTGLSNWSELPTGLAFAGGGGMRHGDVNGLVNSGFSRFNLPEGLPALLRDVPPVQAPFGARIQGGATEAVLYQRVGPVNTTDPLLVVREVDLRRTAALAGEGLWRWRMFDYAVNGNHETFDAFVNGLVQYLALKEDRRFFRVSGAEEYMENQRVTFTAELYDESYEPVTDAEVHMEITDANGQVYPFVFTPSGSRFRLDAGILRAGSYTYRAHVERAGRNFTDEGRFYVRTFELEGANLTADHNLLRAISANSGGRTYTVENIGDLVDQLIGEEGSIKPVSQSSQVLRSLLEFKWIFFVLLALLSTEWFVRKRSGFY